MSTSAIAPFEKPTHARPMRSTAIEWVRAGSRSGHVTDPIRVNAAAFVAELAAEPAAGFAESAT